MLNTRWTTGELRQVRCAVEWRGADDRQTSWLVTLPLRAAAYTHALAGSPLVKYNNPGALPVAPSAPDKPALAAATSAGLSEGGGAVEVGPAVIDAPQGGDLRRSPEGVDLDGRAAEGAGSV